MVDFLLKPLGLLLLFLLLPSVAFAQMDDEDTPPVGDQVVVVNAQIAVDIPYDFGDISGGSAEIIRVVPLREARQLLIAGRRSGTTNIIIYDEKGVRRDTFDVTVIPANLSRVMRNVQELLDDIEGLRFRVINDRVYIQGEVSLDEDLQRVAAMAAREPLVESMVTLSPVSQRLLADLIQKEIGVPGVQVRLISNKIFLEGVVHSQMASVRAEAIARAYYQDVVNVLEVRQAERIPGRSDTVVVIVHFVELVKSLVSSWAFEWSPISLSNGIEFYYTKSWSSAGSDFSASASTSAYALLPRLNVARTAGYARILENPSVAVKSGDTAHIFSGSEVPFVVAEGMGGTSIDYKEVGVTLNVTPFAQGDDVDLQLEVTSSSLGETAPSGYQMIDKSTITTTEYCRAGESIVIGGLQRVYDRVIYNGKPTGSDTPGNPLFTLYKSKDYKKAKSQFLVFITPQVHENSTQANKELQDRFNLIEVRQ